MNRAIRWTPLVLCAVFAACSDPAPKEDPAPAADTRRDDLREAALRWTMKEAGDDIVRLHIDAKAWYIELEGDIDPADVFLARFKDASPPVRKGSLCHVPDKVKDKATGETGVLFRIDSIEWDGGKTATVTASFLHGNQGGSGYTLEIAEEDSRWVVRSGRNDRKF